MRSNYVSATPPATRDTRTLRLLGALLLLAAVALLALAAAIGSLAPAP